MAKAFSIEDGNLANIPLTSSLTKTYSDIDLTFTNRPSGDVYKKTDAAAVKQAIKNILLTNQGEKPFDPYYGGELNSFLFSLSAEFDELDIKETIVNAINNYEPRADVRQVNVKLEPDYNSMVITVVFQVITTSEIEQVEVTLTRLR
jgi:phage baseplate assembly protein W